MSFVNNNISVRRLLSTIFILLSTPSRSDSRGRSRVQFPQQSLQNFMISELARVCKPNLASRCKKRYKEMTYKMCEACHCLFCFIYSSDASTNIRYFSEQYLSVVIPLNVKKSLLIEPILNVSTNSEREYYKPSVNKPVIL